MRVRRERKPGRPKAPNHAERGGMWARLQEYVEWMLVRNYSSDTAHSREADLLRFIAWCDERTVIEPTDVTQPILERYQRWLYYHRGPTGRPLSFRTQRHVLTSVKLFFRWLTRQHVTLFNPAAELDMPRCGRRLPRDVLTVVEVESVISQPNVTEPVGVRDRAILETFYSTGIRRKELARLALYDLEQSRGTLMVREGKNEQDRVVPIGDRARAWIDKYLSEVRPLFAMEPDDGYLFLTNSGHSIPLSMLSAMVRRYIVQAKIDKHGGCHIFRHTVATLMLENGADIRVIQDILGHRELSTTAIYTHVSIARLQQVHRATHPAEQARAGREVDGAGTSVALPDIEAILGDDDEDDRGELAGPVSDRRPG